MEIIRVFITALAMISVSFVVSWGGVALKMKATDPLEGNILKPPKIIFLIGLIVIILCYGIIAYIYIFDFNEVTCACSVVVFLISFLGVYLILYGLNWRITMRENDFVFRNVFRREKTYSYGEITGFRRIKIGGFRIFIGKKSIAIDSYIRGQSEFLDKIKNIHIPLK